MDRYRVRGTADLGAWDPNDMSEFPDGKKAGRRRLKELNDELAGLQEVLHAEGKHKVLMVLQAMDTGGKDGTIRNVFSGVNPQGVQVFGFKKPTDEEMAHDYLWRVHDHTPASGKITIFNRSHYEDVLVVRVMDLVPKKRWSKRYDHIVNFEQMLADEGTTIVKIFLHISKDEQRERLQARLDEPEKNWKFDKGDLVPRAHWDDYQEAFEDAITATSTDDAPWFVVPADRKWYRNLVISEIIIQTLEGLDMSYPEADPDIANLTIPE